VESITCGFDLIGIMCKTFISIIITFMILFFLQSRIIAMDIILHEGSALTVCIQHIDIYTIRWIHTHARSTEHSVIHSAKTRMIHAWHGTRYLCVDALDR